MIIAAEYPFNNGDSIPSHQKKFDIFADLVYIFRIIGR